MKNRTPSTSITELVKTVAKEVISERLKYFEAIGKDHEERLCQLEDFWKKPFVPDNAFIKELESDMEKAGGPWYPSEDKKLEAEINVIIRFLAKRHSRSRGAIKARIRQRELIRG